VKTFLALNNNFQFCRGISPLRVLDLSTKAAITAVLLFVGGFFPLVYLTSSTLERNLETLLVNQQASSVRFVANDLEQKIMLRTEALQDVAKNLPVEALNEPTAVSSYLAKRIAIYRFFPNGVNVIGKDGIGIADEPPIDGRTHGDFFAQEYFQKVMQSGQATISTPRIGRYTNTPGVVIAVPIRNREGIVQAVLAGFINLTDKRIFDLEHAMLGNSGYYTLVDSEHRIIIADRRPGVALKSVDELNLGPLTELIFDGQNNHRIGLDLAGTPSILTDAHILNGHWVLMASLPTAEAYAPIAKLKQQIYSTAVLILLIFAALAWWLMRRQLGDVTRATQSLQAMAMGTQEVRPLPIPVQRGDEVGQMIHAFNMLQQQLHDKDNDIRQSNERFQNLFVHMSNGFALHQMVDDAQGRPIDYRFLEVNPAFERLTGLHAEHVVGKTVREVMPALEPHWIEKYARVASTGVGITFEDFAKPLGKWYRVTAYCPQAGTFAVIIEDITELKKSQKELKHLAYHDVLTGLPNRALFSDRIEHAVSQSRRRQSVLAVAYLDLDGFKPVNDGYGHAVGDLLLIEVSKRLRGALRSGDSVARIGGDEFALLLSDIGSSSEMHDLLERLIALISKPYCLLEHEIKISASVGVTVYPEDAAEPDTLLRHADEALYAAKDAGRNCYRVYSDATKLESHRSSNDDR
jgi:diguanylate cyclase (GGDEF)-like protein/PAS domain S-box-containing protein